MSHDRILKQRMTRRDFLWLMGVAGSAATLLPWLTGCATDPVTGQKTLVGMSEAQEITLDKSQSQHQFSADYGAYQDDSLNHYLESVSHEVWKQSHRPGMPYNARVVNANYINAYTLQPNVHCKKSADAKEFAVAARAALDKMGKARGPRYRGVSRANMSRYCSLRNAAHRIQGCTQ